jgi:hypothetical protein
LPPDEDEERIGRDGRLIAAPMLREDETFEPAVAFRAHDLGLRANGDVGRPLEPID